MVASDEELQRWLAAGPEQEALRAQDPVLGQKTLRRWPYSGDWRKLVHQLRVDEVAEVGLVASYGPPGQGLLVLTDRRLLYVSERVARRPRVVAVARDAIRSMTVREEFRYGTIHIETADTSLDFRGVRNEKAWAFVGTWLAGVDRSDAAADGLPAVAVDVRRAAIEAFETTVTITPDAEALIDAAGGALYLWQEPFNDAFVIDKLSTEQPRGIEFRTFESQGVAVCVATDVARPREIQVGVSRRPRRRIRVNWDGERWGRRGFDLGGGG